MELFFRPISSFSVRKNAVFSLAVWWFLGLTFGMIVSFSAGNSLFPLMRRLPYSPVSIASLLFVLFLPLLFSAFAVYISCTWVLIPAVFLKAFTYAFVSAGVLVSYGTAGWLIRLLLIFSDTLALPILWSFWLSCVRPDQREIKYRILPVFSGIFLIASIDYSIISPFLTEITSL